MLCSVKKIINENKLWFNSFENVEWCISILLFSACHSACIKPSDLNLKIYAYGRKQIKESFIYP
jgi:hypothetical protein